MTHATITHRPTPDNPLGTNRRSCADKLRLVLRLNALNSLVFGALLTAVPERIDDVLDTGHPGWVRVVGVALLPFAALCAWLSTTSVDTLRRVTPEIIVADVTWVVASIATVLLGWYSAGGAVAVLAMAALVDTFALLQWVAWRRISTR
ncbi:hypothetical protein [Ilumatobacter sp.]|uniref:hypothetical protein n=1 Tax=Ilumatobacter sp. TaxID=1967498 RepID=UPI003C33E645